MLDVMINSLTTYYGLDWLTLALGLYGTWLLAKMKRSGFVVSNLSCVCGFIVAAMSLQFGFVVYNIILIIMMHQGYLHWGRQQAEAARVSITD